jgi:hypothetical protein
LSDWVSIDENGYKNDQVISKYGLTISTTINFSSASSLYTIILKWSGNPISLFPPFPVAPGVFRMNTCTIPLYTCEITEGFGDRKVLRKPYRPIKVSGFGKVWSESSRKI